MKKKNEDIVKIYNKKLNELKKHNKFYYDEDTPIISDHKYDQIKKEVIELEIKNPDLKTIDSVSNIVGFQPSSRFSKIKHSKPMLSLSNAFNIGDMEEFLKKVNNYLNNKDLKPILACEPKIDGISASLTYENGILVKGLSRGDGQTG